MTHDDELPGLLASARVLLFDFDGPLCDVYAGLPAPLVARRLTALVAARDRAAGSTAEQTDDPVEVLRIAHAADADLGRTVEAALTAAEVDAVAVAGPPTPGSVAALEAARAAGRAVVVVSDNSAECVQRFLELHELEEYVVRIVGRPAGQPHLMKPNPFPLITAAEQVHMDVTNCVLIGDSLTDIQAAHAAGTTVIGYADEPHKADVFTDAQADAVVEGMQTIADALTAA
ncbi:HAD-IA family hydrolase [Streptomyces sp. NPDC053755]|uniref:HAD family hydrolase n=1 Tax=Streptomyces sp. NPDC053755 TaxID=3155815 RepID=UPI0034437F42